MDYRQTLLVLLAVLLCSSQGLTETPTEASLTPQETSTETIPKSTPQGNVSDLLKMMNILNRRILEVTKTDYEMNTRIMTRLDEMNSESVKRFEEINSTMMARLDEMNSETVKRFEENNSTMFSLFDKLDKKTQKNSDESLKKSEEMDNKLMKRLDEMNAETVNSLNEMDLRVKSLEGSSCGKEKQFVLITNERKTWQGAYDDCIKRNMMLASIESEEENNKVVSLLKTTDRFTRFWLSGTDLGPTGRYVWKSTGRDVTYNQWYPGQPDNNVWSDGEVSHCMWVYSGSMQWADYKCSLPLYYICQH